MSGHTHIHTHTHTHTHTYTLTHTTTTITLAAHAHRGLITARPRVLVLPYGTGSKVSTNDGLKCKPSAEFDANIGYLGFKTPLHAYV